MNARVASDLFLIRFFWSSSNRMDKKMSKLDQPLSAARPSRKVQKRKLQEEEPVCSKRHKAEKRKEEDNTVFAGIYVVVLRPHESKNERNDRPPTFTSIRFQTRTGPKKEWTLQYIGRLLQENGNLDLPFSATDEWAGALRALPVYGCRQSIRLTDLVGQLTKDDDFHVPFRMTSDMGEQIDYDASITRFDTYFSSMWNPDRRVAELCMSNTRLEMPIVDAKTGNPILIARHEHGIRIPNPQSPTCVPAGCLGPWFPISACTSSSSWDVGIWVVAIRGSVQQQTWKLGDC